MSSLIDLHTHSTCSDGLLAPAALVERAHRGGLAGIALTDHDTVAGFAEAHAAGERLGVAVYPGVELSVRLGERVLHLLGFFFDPLDAAFGAFLAAYAERRQRRAASIVDRLQRMGLPLTVDEVAAQADGAIIGRPHIARALVAQGSVCTVEDVFARFLRDGGSADVPLECPGAREALDALHAAGGVGLLAHPGHWTSDHEIRTLRGWGLDGIEIVHPSHDRSLRAYYRQIAGRLGLRQSGGSDYHGYRKSDEKRFGRIGMPAERFEAEWAACLAQA